MAGGEISGLLHGPLLQSGTAWPLTLWARLCDLRPRFLPKAVVRGRCRAVSRNGRVLLASDVPPADLIGRAARLRLQTWHRRILPGDSAEPYGLLLCVRAESEPPRQPVYATRLVATSSEDFVLGLDVGGRLLLAFREARPG